jgi:hypothetical protein
MPLQDAKHAQDPGSPGSADSPGSPGRRLSRRSLLQGAATAGAAGLAVTALGAAASPALAGTRRVPVSGQPGQSSSQQPGHAGPADPIVVHVRDARSGDIEVFSGTSQTRLRDQDLAARIARAVG